MHISPISMFYDDDDNDDKQAQDDQEQIIEGGDYNLGDDIGARIGEGHDPDAEPV